MLRIKNPVVVLDLETTGTWIEKDKIIEIGMIKCLENGTTTNYLQRVNPGMKIPPFVSQLTGIKDADVAEAPVFRLVAPQILQFLENCDFGGFNVERFDLPLLEREIFDAGLRFSWRIRKIFDAQKIYHQNERRDLKAAYKFYCRKDLINAHTALGDTEAALEILEAQLDLYGSAGKTLEDLVIPESLTDYFDSERKFRWWNEQLYPCFGKYARRYPIQQIVVKDRSYIEYLLKQDFDAKIIQMLREALNGKIPERSAP